MIEEVVSIELPVHERMVIKKNRLTPKDYAGEPVPRISIVTGIHGDELDGQYVCYEVIRRVNNNLERLKGIIDIYPDVNPLGIDTGSRGIPMFELDMNRVFPGDNNGAVAESVAAGIVNDIIGSDFCLDIHSSNIFVREMPQVRLNEENAERLLPFAKMLNADFVWIFSSITVLDATLAYSLNHLGVPTLVAEMGVGNRINREYSQQLIDGIFNLMSNLGIWEIPEADNKIAVREPIISTEGEVNFLTAKESGIFVPSINSCGNIHMGDAIGDIIEPIEGRIIQHIESPVDGIVFTLRENPVVYKGALLARVHGGRVMKKEVLYSLKGIYRENFEIEGYRFGHGEKSACIVGAMRGNEIQQLYICSQLIKVLKDLEMRGAISHNHEILVIPSANRFSMNVEKRFWPVDNTDINRMFPGDEAGDTTKQIAAAIFESSKGYSYGIQFASFYMPGDFIPHVRMMETGYQSASLANLFGLQYVVIRKPKPMDTATLNYSWQMNGTNAFSIYTNSTDMVDEKSARQAVSSVLRFLTRMGILKYNNHSGYIASVINEYDLSAVKTYDAGFYKRLKEPGDPVVHNEVIGQVIDPCEGYVKSEILSPTDGIVFFAHTAPLVMGNEVVYKIIRRMHE